MNTTTTEKTPMSKDERQAQDDGRQNFGSEWPYFSLKREYDKVLVQRDELLAALRQLVGRIEADGPLNIVDAKRVIARLSPKEGKGI